VLANRLLIAEVVIVLQQAVEPRLIHRAPHRCDLNRPQRLERHRQRRVVDSDRFWPRAPGPALASDLPAHGRQLDLPGPLQHQQQAATNHVA